MAYYCGIDIGASTAKLVIIDEQSRVLGKALRRSGADYAAAANHCRQEALAAARLAPAQLAQTIATGYGRDNVAWADGAMTEIACHGKGVYHHCRRGITVVDIGAQDSKVIRLDDAGRRVNFKMNRKCAAGTGAFLEEIAYRLDLPLDQLNALAERSAKELTLSSFCTVFAATEVLAKIRAGERVEDIVKGAFRAVVKRILEMDPLEGPLAMTGGVVAHNPLLVRLLEDALGQNIFVPPDPQYVGAFGAALFAQQQCLSADGGTQLPQAATRPEAG